jgi:hypothetical protein
MTPFLKYVAHDLYQRTDGDLAHTVVVFPGKRAGLFFNRFLLEASNGLPLFAPRCMTLEELFAELTDLRADDSIRLVCLLHRLFCRATGSYETIDSFYTWGQLLLSDFDDIDKNLVEAKGLFRNLDSYHELSSPDEWLTDEQRKVLRKFFEGFQGESSDSKLRSNFKQIWKVMGTIYDDFHAQLRSEGHASNGMLCRDAIEHFDAGRLTAKRYALVGFNVLNAVEQKLFDELKATGKALFYWDYDHYYLDNCVQEAGLFIRNNLKRYGNALDERDYTDDNSPYDNLRHLPAIDIVLANTDHAQADYAHDWISKNLTDDATETAVVLCNEALVQPVLHALPSNVKEVNVTMGYPMTLTTVFHDLKELVSKPTDAPASEWLSHLSHSIDEMASTLKRRENRLQEEEEALYRTHLAVNSLRRLVDEGVLTAGHDLLVRLLLGIFRTTSIPFHGEPARGLQVMGVLETRNLDFRHLLLLSVNEGMLPRKAAEVSFIPYSLRRAFGLTTIERQTAVYAYYFYRMIQRAERLTIVCNNGTDGLMQQVPSRFITQLMVEHEATIRHHTLLAENRSQADNDAIVIPQTDATRRKLRERFSLTLPDGTPKEIPPLLSPTALNAYLTCRLKFYLRYVEGIRFDDEDTEDVTVAQFGTLFHHSAELAYERLTTNGRTIRRSDVETLHNNEIVLEKIVNQAFREKYFKVGPEEEVTYDGIHHIHFVAILTYLKQLLAIDAAYAPFDYIAGEKRITENIVVQGPDDSITVQIGGDVDRMDSKEGITRIIDYKTGGNEESVKQVEDLFDRNIRSRKSKVFQAFCYAWILSRHDNRTSYSPALLYTKRTVSQDYNPCIRLDKTPITNFRIEAFDSFDKCMQSLLQEIFFSDEPYTQVDDENKCRYCDFCALCARNPREF